jgi:uncharacterized protein YbjT (DUF2867 family)
MKTILVIGASGFVGRHVAEALLLDKYAVRCLARNPSRAQELARAGCEIVPGDISDGASIERALESVQAAYISIHTLSPQHANTAGQGFMEVEMNGLQNIVAGCRTQGVRRLIYVTSLGIASDASNTWVRERWKTEQFLLKSGLDVTVIRPGQIVGVGGHGFDMMVSQAKRAIAFNLFGSGRQKMRNIAVDGLIYYLVGVLNDPRAYGRCYEVGCDDLLTNNQMIDIAAELLGRKHPLKLDVPRPLLRALGPIIERAGKLPKGSIQGVLDGHETELNGDPMPIRTILPRPPLSYRRAVEQALNGSGGARA